jgi:hypothetical protein
MDPGDRVILVYRCTLKCIIGHSRLEHEGLHGIYSLLGHYVPAMWIWIPTSCCFDT